MSNTTDGNTIFEDAAAALKYGFSKENMLSKPSKFTAEGQFDLLEKSLEFDHDHNTTNNKNNTNNINNTKNRTNGGVSSSTTSHTTHPIPPSSPDSPPSSPLMTPPSTVPIQRVEEMSIREAIWVTLDDPSSSRAAQLIAAIVMGMIIVSCTAFVIQTLPQYIESTDNTWNIIEDLCITVFTIEFCLRIGSAPSRWKFIRQPLNIVDFLAILPFYLELLLGTAAGGSAVIRIIRLVRIFRIFKLSRYLPWVRVFTNALALSLQPLLMLVLVVMIAVVLFSSVIYYAERGEWDEMNKVFMRFNPIINENTISPYQSIPDSFWWCIVTMTTVGYGDVYPVTPAGRFIAALASLSGILVVAIPVSIISTNFNSEYAKLQRQREQVKARMLLLKRHFRDRKTGLDAVLDEVEDIVKRNTQEFQEELETLFEQARSELTEELQEVLRMAYERRRQLHLAALAAGRVQSSVIVPSPTSKAIRPPSVPDAVTPKRVKTTTTTTINNGNVPVFGDFGADVRKEVQELEMTGKKAE